MKDLFKTMGRKKKMDDIGCHYGYHAFEASKAGLIICSDREYEFYEDESVAD